MLFLGSRLIGTPIMGLQTGTQLAEARSPIIDPSNLMIVGYEVEGPLLVERPSFIRIADVRELSDVGMIVDSSDEFIGISDVISVEKIYKLGFNLLGLLVIDETKRKLGKVSDYSIDTGSFMIVQLNVSRGVLKSLTESELLVHRSQIVEINDKTIVVRSATGKLEPIAKSDGHLSYMNPFRSTAAPVDGNNS